MGIRENLRATYIREKLEILKREAKLRRIVNRMTYAELHGAKREALKKHLEWLGFPPPSWA